MTVLDRLGLQGATRLDHWLGAGCCLNAAFAPFAPMIHLCQLPNLVRVGGQATQRSLQLEAALVGVGEGELSAATQNIGFLASLLMPMGFAELYMALIDTCPAAPYLLAALLHVLSAEVATPWGYAQLSPAVAAAARPRSGRGR